MAPQPCDGGPPAGLVVQSVPRIGAPSVEVFQHAHVLPRRPVVLCGLVSDWPATRQWSLDYLQGAFATTLVTTARIKADMIEKDERKGLLFEYARFGEFIDALRAGARDRYMMSRMEELPQDLRGDAPPPAYSADAPWQRGKLWISAPSTVSALHRDLADNLHAQVCGRKRFTLVAPCQSSLLYPNTLFDSLPNGCRIDIEHPDFTRFPRLRGVETLVAELAPADAIYIPRGWWHHVRTLDLSISVNFWWARGVQRAIVVASDWVKRLRGIAR